MKYTKLSRDQLNGVYCNIHDFPVKDKQRYDIEVNSQYQYSLVLRDCSNDSIRTIIDYSSNVEFMARLLELKKDYEKKEDDRK